MREIHNCERREIRIFARDTHNCERYTVARDTQLREIHSCERYIAARRERYVIAKDYTLDGI